MANLKITLHHGLVNRTPKQRATAQSLGLRKIGQSVIREDNSVTRGMMLTVRHSLPLRRLTDYGQRR